MAWKYFQLDEFKCHCGCGRNLIEENFVDKLEKLRTDFGAPLVVSSGYRCPEHNARVSSTGRTGPHTTGRAVDFLVERAEAYILLEVALDSHQFTGIGVNQKGAGRFIHLDDLQNGPGQPRPTVWSY